MPKITFGMNTAQEDYPLVAYPDVHVFEFLMRQLRKQTFKDFEVIIADVKYNTRKDYFVNNQEDFPVIHVPIKSNIWIPNNSCAISTTKNTFLLYARGEIVVSMGDCAEFDGDYLMRINKWCTEGFCCTSRFSINQGGKVIVKDIRQQDSKDVHGNIAMRMTDWLGLNGYDEMFDGGKGCEDLDIGYRLVTANKRVKLLEDLVVYQHHMTCNLLQTPNSFKCQEMWWYITRFRDLVGVYAANRFPIRDDEFELLRKCYKGTKVKECPIHLKPCKRVDENGCCVEGVNEEMFKLYKHPSLTFSLIEQRKDVRKALIDLDKMCEEFNCED